jgi:CubicO group peptidase (beta-lactamase class C family)
MIHRDAVLAFALLAGACVRRDPAASESNGTPEAAAPQAASQEPDVAQPVVPDVIEERFIEQGAVGPWPVVSPATAKLDRHALVRLVAAAEKTGSDSLLVLSHGRAVVARTFGQPIKPIESMSVTKGFVGIAIGFLLEEHKIASLDTPLSTWFSEWKTGAKAKVTLRHILTHTSGLAHKPAAGVLAKQRDRLAYVRALPIEGEPGETFSYNNEATQLLSGVVAAAAHEPLDKYLQKRLFEPLAISEFSWEHDGGGNVGAFAGLALNVHDLAKVGVTLESGGLWNGVRVVPASWLTLMQQPSAKSPVYGNLTWLVRDHGENGDVVGYDFNGWLGQYLAVYPHWGVVAVRQRKQPPNVTDDDHKRIGLVDFTKLVRAACGG